jgi:hypothetical protein
MGREKLRSWRASLRAREDHRVDAAKPAVEVLRLEESDSTGFELADHFDGLVGDLSHADTLLGDAVRRLAAGFLRISELMCKHREVTGMLVNAVAPQGGGSVAYLLERQAGVAEQIERELRAIVVSLQFGDLVTQLLGHGVSRIESLRDALQRKGVLPQHGSCCGSCRGETSAEEPDGTPDPTSCGKPVIQREMCAGSIELF